MTLDARAKQPRGKRLTRRSMLKWIGIAGGAATSAGLLAACGPTAPTASPTAAPKPTAAPAAPTAAPAAKPTTAPGAAPTIAPAAAKPTTAPAAAPTPTLTPKYGGTLNFMVVGDTLPLVRHRHTQNPQIRGRSGNIFDTLLEPDPMRNPLPGLAETWEVSGDKLQIKLNLRKGVMFHSGREFTAQDASWNILKVRDNAFPNTFAPLRSMAPMITSVMTPDKYTLILGFNEPNITAFEFLYQLDMQDKETLEDNPTDKTLIGTGPFKFVEYVPGVRFVIEKNPTYWRSGRPYLDRVVIHAATDAQASANAVEAGTADVVYEISSADAARLRRDPRFRYEAGGSSNGHIIAVNIRKPPVDNKLFRQALSHALDRQRITQLLLAGLGRPASSWWPKDSLAYEESKANAIPFDLDKARSLLQQSGVTDRTITLVYSVGGYEDLAPIWQDDLAKIGITLQTRQLDKAAHDTMVLTPGGTPENPWHVSGQGGPFFGQEPVLELIASLGGIQVGYNNPVYEQLKLDAQREFDATKRKAIYSRVNDLWLDEQFMIVSGVSDGGRPSISKARVHDIRWKRSFLWDDAWIE